MNNYYTIDGLPSSAPTHVETIIQTRIDGVLVSTIFLGRDHRLYYGGGSPQIFETMVFANDVVAAAELDEWCDRYPTIDQARAGHEAAIRLVTRALGATS